MPQCCVFGCKNASGTTSEENGKHVSYHLFPAKVSLRNLWNKRINRVNFTASKFSVVCSVHFKEEDIIEDTCAKIMGTWDNAMFSGLHNLLLVTENIAVALAT